MTTLTAATPTMVGGMAPVAAVRPALGPAPGLSAGDLWRILRQRLVLILVLWGLSIGLTIGFTWFMVRYYPKYRATALVRVVSANPVNVLNPLEQRDERKADVDLLVQNQAILLKSPDVLRNVFEDANIKTTRFFQWVDRREKEKNEDRIELLSDIIGASPARNSNFIYVTATWEVPKEASLLANAVVKEYLAKVNALQKEGIDQTRGQLEREVQRAEKIYEAKRLELENLRSSSGEGEPTGTPSEHVLTLEALVTELKVDAIGRQAQYEALANVRPEDLPITAELQAILAADPLMQMLERQALDVASALTQLEARYGKNHPTVKTARVSRDTAIQAAAEERTAKLRRYQQEQIEQARRNAVEAQMQTLELEKRLQEAQAEQADRYQRYARYLRLVEELELMRTQYQALQEQRNLMMMVSRPEAKLVQIDVASYAVDPKIRSSPTWIIWLPTGVLLGFMISAGVALLLEMADKSVRTPRDVPRVPVLGIIPTADDDEVEIERVETASIDVPHSIVAEAFRNLRANLFFSAPAEQQGVLLVTSPGGGNGKTTVASNLAISVALSGRRVLLIDANFRRPGLPRLFPNARPEGLSNILIGQGRLAEMVTTTSVPGLDVLCSGPTPPNPAELLGSSYLRDIVADARSQYDQVIFDGPPVLLVSDAMVLAGAVDGVLVVCQYRSTSRGAFQRTQTQLEAINARIFGAVLNQVETRAGGYFRKIYREFYEYQEPEEGAGAPRLWLETKTGETQLQAPRTRPAEGMGEPDRAVGTPPVASNEKPTQRNGGPRQEIAAASPRVDLDTVIDLGSDLKIDDDFDLGEDLGKPDKPPPAGGKPKD